MFYVLSLTIWGLSMFEANGSTVALIQDRIFLIVLDLAVESGLIDDIASLGILEKNFRLLLNVLVWALCYVYIFKYCGNVSDYMWLWFCRGFLDFSIVTYLFSVFRNSCSF